MSSVRCRFDLLTSGDPPAVRTLHAVTLPAVPVVGELINIAGDPYTVVRREWACIIETPHDRWAVADLYCFLTILSTAALE